MSVLLLLLPPLPLLVPLPLLSLRLPRAVSFSSMSAHCANNDRSRSRESDGIYLNSLYFLGVELSELS